MRATVFAVAAIVAVGGLLFHPTAQRGIPPDDVNINLAERIIFKGLTVLGINGRKMFETWYQTEALVRSGRIDLRPIITHVLPYSEFTPIDAFQLLLGFGYVLGIPPMFKALFVRAQIRRQM